MSKRLASVYHPGEMLQEKLKELAMPIKEFALRCGKPEPTIHDVLRGRSAVTPEMAIRFEEVLRIPVRLWLNMQSAYDEFVARRKRDDELQSDISWIDQFPFSEMIEKGYLAASPKNSELEKLKLLLRFFGFSNTRGWEKYYQEQIFRAEFCLSLKGVPDVHALSAWLRYGEIKAQHAYDLPRFDTVSLKSQVPKMQALANSGKDDFLSELTELCKKVGVILVCTPQLKNTKVCGATRWLKETPLVQIADNYGRYDSFWFYFFHEIAHLLLHGKRDVFLEGVEYEQKNPSKEREADAFASNCLVPRHVVNCLKKFAYTEKTLHALCAKEHLHKAFVVGRLQTLGLIGQSVGNQHIHSLCFSQ